MRAMFDRIAGRYDLANHLLSAGMDSRWRRIAIDALSLGPGARLLDLCTGTGDVLLEWLRHDRGNRGVGVDGARGMLTVARRKLLRASGAARGSLVAADAGALCFADGSFDGAVVAFGMRNIAERSAVLAEVARTLRRAAPLVLLEFGWPRGALGRVYALYFSHVLPRAGRWLSGDPGAYGYLPESTRRFPAPAAIVAELAAAGFVDATCRPLAGGIVYLYRACAPPA